jgi:hypothetical protein
VSAERGNPSAPGRLAKYYFATSIVSGEKRVLVEPASKAAYWGIVATRVDPDPSARAESQKLVDMLFGAAPSLKPQVETMLAASALPSF